MRNPAGWPQVGVQVTFGRAGAGNSAHLLPWESSGLWEAEWGDLASPWGGAWSSPKGHGDAAQPVGLPLSCSEKVARWASPRGLMSSPL